MYTEPRIMGATRDDFIKYPRTPHLFGSKGTDDDRHLGQKESEAFIADQSLIVEEKLDGTNVGIHFNSRGRMVLQCRGHEITEGMHPQYDLFKKWTSVKRPVLEAMLGGQFILYGESLRPLPQAAALLFRVRHLRQGRSAIPRPRHALANARRHRPADRAGHSSGSCYGGRTAIAHWPIGL